MKPRLVSVRRSGPILVGPRSPHTMTGVRRRRACARRGEHTGYSRAGGSPDVSRTAVRPGHADACVRTAMVAVPRCEGTGDTGELPHACRALLPAAERADRPAGGAGVRP